MFDHRTNIADYVDILARKYDEKGDKHNAVVARVIASNIRNEIDIRPGVGGITTPCHAIIVAMCDHMDASSIREVLAPEMGDKATQRVRVASMWVAKKKLGWGAERLGAEFRRDPSTVTHALKRAEEIRAADGAFKLVTDNATAEEFRCENCQHSLLGNH